MRPCNAISAVAPFAALIVAGAMFALTLAVLPGSLRQLEAVGTPAETRLGVRMSPGPIISPTATAMPKLPPSWRVRL